MKKLLLIVSIIAMASLYAVADDQPKVTIDFTVNNWNMPTSSSTGVKGDFSFTNGTYTVTGNAQTAVYFGSNSCMMLGKKGSYLNLPVFDFDVARIDIEGGSAASAAVQQNIYVGTTAVSTTTTGAQTTNSYEIATAYQGAGTQYTLKVESGHNTQVYKVYVYEAAAGDKKSAGLKWSEASVEVELGTAFTSPTLTKTTTAAVSFASDNEAVATVNADGVISLAGATGIATITASSAENDEYNAGEAHCTVTVYNYITYYKNTTVTDGEQYLIVAQRDGKTYHAIPQGATSNYGYLNAGSTDGLVDEITMKSSYNDYFTFSKSGDGWYIQDYLGRYYAQEGTYNSFQIKATAPETTYTITPNADGTFDIVMNGYMMQWGASTFTTFALYTTLQTNAVKVMLYGKTSSGIDSVIDNGEQSNAPVQYFDLQGREVSNPDNGLYLRRQGKKVEKVVIR